MTNQERFDLLFSMRLEQWIPLRRSLHAIFNQHEIDTLHRSERSFRPGARQVVLLAFENRIASLGGLAPVMKNLPQYLKKNRERVMFMSPFHAGHPGMRSALKTGLLEVCFKDRPFKLCAFESAVTCYRDTAAEIPTYYLAVPDRFSAGENPYAYKDQNDLLRDTLVFCAAVPFALSRLGLTEHLLFHAHDWETSLIAITSRMAVLSALIGHARTILTLHNSFDAGFPTSFQMTFFGKEIPGETVLQCSIPFLNGPLITVSTPFAAELANDPLQKTFFADHLQKLFCMNPPVGIENGLFGEARPLFSNTIEKQADTGNFDRLLVRKRTFKRRFLKALRHIHDKRIIGRLDLDPHDMTTPVFYMAGRLDFMQKGFDVMFHAFERLPRHKAKLLFCPSSRSGRGRNELAFFREFVERCGGDIEIWPFKIPRRLYDLFLRGSTFLLMPSLYEPFGSANEGLMNGTPVVARATGGLWLQVNSVAPVKVPVFYRDLPLAKLDGRPTGILYREEYPDHLASREWRDLLELPPAERRGMSLYESLVDAAYDALLQAVEIGAQPDAYAALIYNGIREVDAFSWVRAADKHIQVYDVAVNRGM